MEAPEASPEDPEACLEASEAWLEALEAWLEAPKALLEAPEAWLETCPQSRGFLSYPTWEEFVDRRRCSFLECPLVGDRDVLASRLLYG